MLEGHSLITSGPYQLARHPMYTVFFIYTIGLLFATNNWLLFLAVLVNLIYASSRIRDEEYTMLKEFREEYVTYKRSVGAFLPCTDWFCECGVPLGDAEVFVTSQQISTDLMSTL